MSRCVLSILAVIVFVTAGAAAPLDAERKEPYRWRILLRCSKHPFLDDAFRDRLARELKAALQPGLGLLGGVEIIDVNSAATLDAIGKEFQTKGLPALETTANRPLNGIKYHGLTIDYTDGAFRLGSRQYDGFTGLASPLLRTREVRTRDQIARHAGLMLEPDFGIVATIEAIPLDEKNVKLVLRGSDLGPTDKLVSKGDLFAVAIVKEAKPTGRISSPQQYTYLKAIEPAANGTCTCVILTRWANPFGSNTRQVLGKRAMKLPTLQGVVRVQLVDKTGKPNARGSRLTVTASDVDFTARGANDGFEWRDGIYRSLRPYAHVACISIGVGLDRPQLFPVPVLNDDVLTLVFEVDPAAERRAEFIRVCNDLRFSVADIHKAQVANAKVMSQLNDAARHRDALARAEEARTALDASEKALSEELKHLLAQPGVSDPAAKEILDACERQLVAIRDGVAQLNGITKSLKEAIAKAGSSEAIEKEFRGQELAGRIKDLLTRGDVPDAIAAYDKLIELYPADDAHKDAREKLKAEWAPKDDEHRAARDVIRNLAAARTFDDFKTMNETLNRAIPTLKAKKDRLGLRKLLNTFEPALVAFRELQDANGPVLDTPEKLQKSADLKEVYVYLAEMEKLTRGAIKDLANEAKK